MWIWTDQVLYFSPEGVGPPEILASFREVKGPKISRKELLAGTWISSFSQHEANEQPPGQQIPFLVMCP